MLSNSFSTTLFPEVLFRILGPKKGSVLHISAPHFKIFTEGKINGTTTCTAFLCNDVIDKKKR